MRPASRRKRFLHMAFGTLALFAPGPQSLLAEEAATPYAKMAPIDQYLMDRDSEIALARSAAPKAISQDATVLVLGRHGYKVAVQGTNSFVCMVERGWIGSLDGPEMWNPKIRGADCLNPPAARSILPMAELRTEMFIEGRTPAEVAAKIRESLSKSELPLLEPGAMSYMMSKESYLTDSGNHNGPHLMFFMPIASASTWGSGLPGSPVNSVSYWFNDDAGSREAYGLPPIRIFTVGVNEWSDGTAASSHHMH